MAESDKSDCLLYLITPPTIEVDDFAQRLVRAIDTAPDVIGAVQLRLKDTDDDAIKRAAEALLPICHAADLPLIMNDRADIAKNVGADGVHVGQNDTPYQEARALLGKDAIIGVTCHDSRHLAMVAGEAGADYVAFGAFFPSSTKPAKYHAEPELLDWCSSMTVIPCVAIGGITVENCSPLVEAGADYLAVIGGVWNHPDGEAAAVSAFAKVLRAN